MSTYQAGILQPVPDQARYLFFSLLPDSDPRPVVTELAGNVDGDSIVVGLGSSLVKALGAEIEGLKDFPVHSGKGIDVPSTPQALLCWLRGSDRGELIHRTRTLRQLLEPAFELDNVIDCFKYGPSLDLGGYEDGTENPTNDEAVQVAIVAGQGKGMDGSSFLAIQQWLHDLDYFLSLPEEERDDIFGRHRVSNEEFDEAPESAHVKRTAQESFEPEAFVVRRSMPWSDSVSEGLVFTAYGHSVAAYEAQLNRMVGNEDGIVDGLFRFTRPVTGAYFWCPPMTDKGLDLRLLA